jgi:hypothetical protein
LSLLFGHKPRWVVHPLLVAAAYVLSTALASDVTPAGYARPLTVGVLFAGLLTIACWTLLRNRWDGALLATVIIALLVSPASLAFAGSAVSGVLGASWATPVVAVALLAILGMAGVRIIQARRQGRRLPRPAPETLNLLSVALLAAVIGSSVIGRLNLAVASPVPAPEGWVPAAEKPDIVIILLDGYPRSDVLHRRLGTDDTAFLAELGQRGFDVATMNHSNYTITELTLPSMFQLRYLDQIPSVSPYVGSGRYEVKTLHEAAEAGQAFSILREAGYTMTMSSPGWEHVTYRDVPDRLLDSGELTDLEESLLHRTWLVYLLDAVWPSVFTTSQRDRIVHSFDALDRFAVEAPTGPRFLFLHVPAPHLPLVIQADGSPTDLRASRYEGLNRQQYGMTDEQYEAAWQSELTYVHDRTLRGIDELLASERGRDGVIVVMSDHGYNYETRADDPQARLANLMAVRTPHAPDLVGDSITPVNLLRVVFDRYLGTDFALLPNRYFLHGDHPLDLTEITDPDRAGPGP